MSAASAILITLTFAINLAGVVLLMRWGMWLAGQRRRGFPDRRARAFDRRSVRVAIGIGWIWANVVMAIAVAVAAARLPG